MDILYYIVDGNNGKLDLDNIHDKLGGLGIIQVLVEGGSEIFTNYIQKNKFNKLIVYRGATIIGSNGNNFFNKELGDTMDDRLLIKLESVERIGDTEKIVYTKI